MITPWPEKEMDWSDRSKEEYERHIAERKERGFSFVDAWSFDTYIASVISNYAEHARKTNHGYPMGLTEEKWDKILKTIQIGYGNYAEHKFDTLEHEIKDFKKAQRLFKKWFMNFWD